jgi:hypothetical protein
MNFYFLKLKLKKNVFKILLLGEPLFILIIFNKKTKMNYSSFLPTITISNCAAGKNCAIGESCTATSQCSTGGCCGYFMNPTINWTVFNQYAGTFGAVGTKIITGSNYTYNALMAAYYLA